jgi:hypothetical protein
MVAVAEMVAVAVTPIVEIKDIVEDAAANKRRCKTLGNRLLSLQPTIEVF